MFEKIVIYFFDGWGNKIESAVIYQMNPITLVINNPFGIKSIDFSISNADRLLIINALENTIGLEIAVDKNVILTVHCGHLIITRGKKVDMMLGADALRQMQ